MYFIQKPLKLKQVRGFITFKNLNLVYFYFSYDLQLGCLGGLDCGKYKMIHIQINLKGNNTICYFLLKLYQFTCLECLRRRITVYKERYKYIVWLHLTF